MFMKWLNTYKKQITFISGMLLVLALIANYTGNYQLRQFTLIVATMVAGITIFIKAFQAVRMRVFSIELLVTIAVIGALAIGEYVESAVVTFLFLFGDYLEARTLEKTRRSLKELVDMAPQEATVIQNGEMATIPVEEVVEGDRTIIRSGGKIPVDGRIISGQGALNEAAVTGESIPVTKNLE